MATSKLAFTNERLMRLPVPDKGRVYHYDEKTAGLCLCITHAATRTFYVYRKIHGRPERIRLGKYPDVSISSARDAAAELSGEIAKGRDPAAERQALRESPTLEALFDHWWRTHSKPHKKTWKNDKRLFDKYLGEHKNRRVVKITKADVQRWHAAWGDDHGPYQANRVRSLLSAMFSVAADLGHDGPNPCNGVKKFREESRERFLQPDEMRVFFETLKTEEPLWRDFCLMLLFTGARRGNVATMAWSEIDMGKAVWYLPGKQTKNGRPMVVVLPEPAMAVLQSRREADPDGKWVFPSKTTDGPTEDPRGAWERIRKASGLTDLRMHDLRRSLGSWQAAMGTSLAIVGKSLGHCDPKATQVYARLQLDPVRAAVGAAVTAMIDAGKDKGGDDE